MTDMTRGAFRGKNRLSDVSAELSGFWDQVKQTRFCSFHGYD
jgi:hypothetical protein